MTFYYTCMGQSTDLSLQTQALLRKRSTITTKFEMYFTEKKVV